VVTSTLLLMVWVATWAYVGAAVLASFRFSRRPMSAPSEGPPVSVLKPLYGAEPGLFENLRSFADQDYSDSQVVLGLRDRTDAALPVARALIEARPQRDIALVVDPHVSGSNLKVANLENMLPAARHDVLVIADSDMRVTRDYLAIVVAPLADPAIGIVTCPYKGMPDGGVWSRLAALQINYSFLPGALVGDWIRVGGGCFGATLALRREVLERIGGFGRLRHELADDYRMGSAVRGLGLAAELSSYIVENRITEPSLASLWRRELRWARTSRMMAPGGYAGSVVTHAVVLAALTTLVCDPVAAGALLAGTILLRWAEAAAIARWLDLPRDMLWLLPLRDVLSFAVFIGSFCGRNVSWRDRFLRIGPGGRMRLEGDKPV
jgi:ceramide glucosyltransferase